MEEEEEVYKQYQAKLTETQQLLKQLNKISLGKAQKETRKHVEVHFDKLITALTQRRDQILHEVDHILI